MSTISEKTPEGIVYRTKRSHHIPDIDLLTLLFDSEYSLAKPDTVLHASASIPELALTTSRVRDLTHATSAALRRCFGIGRDGPSKDICSVISAGHYLLPVLLYGIIGAGGVVASSSPASTATELSKQLLDAQSKILFTTEAMKDIAVEAATLASWGEDGGGRVVLMSGGFDWSLNVLQTNGMLSLNLVNENEKLPWRKITDPVELENNPAVLFYSSGTTGLPKGVKISHRNMVTSAIVLDEMLKEGSKFQFRTIAHLPTSHIAGFMCYFVIPMYMGGTTYWMPSFDFPRFLEYCEKYKPTFQFTVPPIWLLIAKSPLVKDQLKSVEIAVSGAAPLGKELQHAASEKLPPNCFISQTWGLSETTGSATFMPRGINDDTGSVSQLMPNVFMRIIDEEGKDVKEGEPGEVLIKSSIVTKGYLQNETANKEAFTGDWFHTGDTGEFRKGLLYIVDRKKELIKYKGLQVAPAELEALLVNHPDILDAAVIGVQTEDGSLNEVPRAYVVTGSKDLTGQQIKDYVKKNAASHKQLRGGVHFLDVIPKSPSGKILRKDLRVLAKKEKGAKL